MNKYLDDGVIIQVLLKMGRLTFRVRSIGSF